MDDTKTITPTTYKVSIGDTEYEFGQPDPELIERMILVSHMNASVMVTLEACTKWLSVAAGPTTWAAIMRQFMDGKITAEDLIKSMLDLVTQWTAPKESAVDAA
jgi:hypothetical protein